MASSSLVYFEEVLARVLEIPGAPSASSSFLESEVRTALNAHPNVDIWEDKFVDAMAYYTLHYYTKIAPVANSSINAVSKGALQSIRTGNLSASYQNNSSFADSGADIMMSSTVFGERYLELRNRIGDLAPEFYKNIEQDY